MKNKTYIFPPLNNQLKTVKALKEKDKIIDLRKYQTLSLEELYSIFIKEIKASKQKKFIILYFDLLLPLSMPLLNLASLQEKRNLHYIFCISTNIFSQRNYKRLKKIPIIFEKIVYLPLKKEKLKNPALFLNNLSEGQRRVLKLAVRGEKDFQPALQSELDYLIGLKILQKKRSRFYIKPKALKKAALKIPSMINSKLILRNKNIIAQNQNITDQFSPNQQKILFLLLKNKGKIVNRDKIAQQLWQDKWTDKYSDWAIDQAVSTLRNKLEKLWINPNIIKTVKGKGFKLK